MATITQETRFELAKGELVTIAKAKSRTLNCGVGELWITAEGDSRDRILRGGETWQIDSDAELVISAIRPSALSVSCRRAPSPAADGARRTQHSLRISELPAPVACLAILIR